MKKSIIFKKNAILAFSVCFFNCNSNDLNLKARKEVFGSSFDFSKKHQDRVVEEIELENCEKKVKSDCNDYKSSLETSSEFRNPKLKKSTKTVTIIEGCRGTLDSSACTKTVEVAGTLYEDGGMTTITTVAPCDVDDCPAKPKKEDRQ